VRINIAAAKDILILVIQKPRSDQPIIVYLSVLEEVVNAVLVQDVEKEGHPIYFFS